MDRENRGLTSRDRCGEAIGRPDVDRFHRDGAEPPEPGESTGSLIDPHPGIGKGPGRPLQSEAVPRVGPQDMSAGLGQFGQVQHGLRGVARHQSG